MKIGEALYKAEGEVDGDDEGAASEAEGGDDVVDADFEEVDEDRKDKSA